MSIRFRIGRIWWRTGPSSGYDHRRFFVRKKADPPVTQEHPFAPYVRILGKGPHLSRPLTFDEARDAAAMIMAGKVEPVQLGAFLCLLRVRTETPEEVGGLARAFKDSLVKPVGVSVDVDWAAWAGKTRQLPYFLLAALTLAGHGISVLMHGAEHHSAGRLYASDALAALGVPACTSVEDAARRLEATKFALLPLSALSQPLHAIMGLKPILGLRSPLHTIGRLLNPFDAPFSINAVTHPPYLAIHQKAARLLGQINMAAFKGEGGEAERRPEKSCDVHFLADGQTGSEEWPALIDAVRPKEETLDPARLKALWTGELVDEIAAATIAGTIAVVLRYSGRAGSVDEAEGMGLAMWRDRIKTSVPGRS